VCACVRVCVCVCACVYVFGFNNCVMCVDTLVQGEVFVDMLVWGGVCVYVCVYVCVCGPIYLRTTHQRCCEVWYVWICWWRGGMCVCVHVCVFVWMIWCDVL